MKSNALYEDFLLVAGNLDHSPIVVSICALEEACEFIESTAKGCPYSYFSLDRSMEEVFGCDNCVDDYAHCWLRYFTHKAKEVLE